MERDRAIVECKYRQLLSNNLQEHSRIYSITGSNDAMWEGALLPSSLAALIERRDYPTPSFGWISWANLLV